MADTKSRLVAGWMAKAEEDISVARLLIRQERRLYAAAVYHCQQAAEVVRSTNMVKRPKGMFCS